MYLLLFTRQVNDMMTSRLILVWHRPPTNSGETAPIAVKAWIEQGSQLQSALLQPKFMWQETHGKDQLKSKQTVLKTLNFHAIDLLDVSRVLVRDSLDKTKYPFAKASCCFTIYAFDQEMLFEASSEKERDHIVHNLKEIISSLGAQIIVGDGRVLDEFFNPVGSVPGQIPGIITGEEILLL